jgi:hypothetical protein
MNRERARELLPIIQAFAEGGATEERIQERFLDEDWRPFDGYLMTESSDYSYRIKPEPREWWVVLDNDAIYIEHSELAAKKLFMDGDEIFKVREVLE